MSTGKINIDLVPYEYTVGKDTLTIHDCPLLNKLVVPERFGWTEYYGDFVNMFSSERFVSISSDGTDCVFGTRSTGAVMDWIDRRYDAINEIGYEVLQDYN